MESESKQPIVSRWMYNNNINVVVVVLVVVVDDDDVVTRIRVHIWHRCRVVNWNY